MNFDNELDPQIVDNLPVVKDNVSSKLPLLPNYTKNPELELEKTLNDLKGGDLSKFKKDVDVPIQKMQSKIKDNNQPTVPQELLQDHMSQITALGGQLGATGPKVVSSPQGQNVRDKMKCKFLASDKCHPSYPNFSGASIGFPEGMRMKCDSPGTEVLPKAICTISSGKISGVYLINKGSGLGTSPKINVVGGGGKGAVLKGIVDNGSLSEIKIISAGEGFHETPQIRIESPSMSDSCYLCCK